MRARDLLFAALALVALVGLGILIATPADQGASRAANARALCAQIGTVTPRCEHAVATALEVDEEGR